MKEDSKGLSRALAWFGRVTTLKDEPSWVGYGVSVIAVGVVLLLGLLIEPGLSPGGVFMLFLTAVIVAAYFGGWRQTVLATTLAALSGYYFFLSTPYALKVGNVEEVSYLALFLLEGIFISVFAAAMHSSRQRAISRAAQQRASLDNLSRSEQWFRSLVQKDSDDTIVLRRDNTILYESPAVTGILGYKPGERVGKNLAEYLHPECVELTLEAFASFSKKPGVNPPVSYRIRDRKGDWHCMEAVGANLLDNPSVRGIVVSSRDVTERRRAEQEINRLNGRLKAQLQAAMAEADDTEEMLRLNGEYFRSLLKNVSDVITVFDDTGTIRYESPSISRVLGYSQGEMIGTNVFDYLHPGDAAGVHKALAEPWDTSETRLPTEFRVRHADGSWRYMESVASRGPDGEDNGAVRGVIVSSRDVTERVRAEQALRESERLYRTVIEQAAESILLVDYESMRILQANPAFCRSLGYNAEEISRMSIYDIVAHDRESIERNTRLVLERGRHTVGERLYRRKNGSLVTVESSASMISYRGKRAMCVVAHDITERKQVEKDLRQSLRVLLSLREAGQVLGSTLEVEKIVSRLLQIMQQVSGLTSVVITMRDEDGKLRVWRSVGLDRLSRGVRFMPEAETARLAALDRDELRRFRLLHPEAGRVVGLCVPLRIQNRIVGVLEAFGSQRLEEDTVKMIASLTSQAASALENAWLYKELKEREHRLQELVGSLMKAQEDERRKVSYEIHDGLAQVAAAAHQRLQAFSRRYSPETEAESRDLERISKLVRQTVTDARLIIANLRPTALDDLGLAAAMSLEVEHLREDGYQVDFEGELGNERLPDTVEISLFRVAQEAITNLRKHAQTRKVRIALQRGEGGVRLEVRDWGRGFDLAAQHVGNGPGERVGFSGMRERISRLGGRVEIQSGAGVGTAVVARVPERLLGITTTNLKEECSEHECLSEYNGAAQDASCHS